MTGLSWTPEIVSDTTAAPEALASTRPAPQAPDIAVIPEVPTPRDDDGQRTLTPRGVTSKLKWPYGPTRKIQETVRSFRTRDKFK